MTSKENILSVQQSYGIIGKNPLLLQAVYAAIQAAPYDVNVLVTGENGVGKEVFHKILHNISVRRHKKCIAVNCGGLPEGTIDSELFGHVKGAYTGATSDRKGYFEECDGGTIFLDEIGELPLSTQARLLRVLESGEFLRMGSSEVRRTNVRVVAATNVDLEKSIKAGTFREDLYYRLSTITIRVPSLRERQEDIFLLFRKFSSDIASKYKMPPITLTDDARRKLQAYQWPGNVRQLLHVVEEISIIEEQREINSEILMRHLPQFDEGVSVSGSATSHEPAFSPGEKEMLYAIIYNLKQQIEEVRQHLGMNPVSPTSSMPLSLPQTAVGYESKTLPPSVNEVLETDDYEDVGHGTHISITPMGVTPSAPQPASRPRTLDEIERDVIKDAIARHQGNKRRAAEELGISERTIHRKMQE